MSNNLVYTPTSNAAPCSFHHLNFGHYLVGLPFCIATYGAEGDDPLVFFCAWMMVFHSLEIFIKKKASGVKQDYNVGRRCYSYLLTTYF